jgi:phosphohistidine phosphatase
MIIHIVRHAEAVERSSDISEEHRYLTVRGRKRFRKAAATARKAGIQPDLILTSPLIRAVQTADILAEKLRYDGELQPDSRLGPGFRPESLDELLDAWPQGNEVALVGHEPDLGALTRTLLGIEEECALKKGAIVSFDRPAGGQGDTTFVQLVTGGGKVITSRNKAVKRLVVEAAQEGQ